MAGPVVGALIGAGASILSNIWSAREAQKNREFQERMSSTAHTREVADLRAAGLNPILSANRGASSPSGSQGNIEDVGNGMARGAATALAVKRQEAEIALIDAQRIKTDVEARQIETLAPYTIQLHEANAAIAARNLEQMREMFPAVLAKARAEVDNVNSATAANRARTLLDTLASKGAINEAKFQETIGQLGPYGKVLAKMVSLGVVGGAAGLMMRKKAPGLPKRYFDGQSF